MSGLLSLTGELFSEMTHAMDDSYWEIVVRPHTGAGWRIELPRLDGPFVVVVSDAMSALRLASTLGKGRDIRFLHDLPAVSNSDQSFASEGS